MPQYKSEIRDSIVQALLEKASTRNFGKYLSKIHINKLRGIEEQSINFDFPVTAIVGTNGSGKTTILGAAAIVYMDIEPRKYFVRGGNLDNDMKNWAVQYELIDKEIKPREIIKRSANYKNLKWNRTTLARPILDFGVSRIVPPIEKNNFNRFANSKVKFETDTIYSISDDISSNVSKILGKDISKFKAIQITTAGQIEFLAGTSHKGTQYLNFILERVNQAS